MMDNDHAQFTKDWLDKATEGLSSQQIVTLVERAIGALWERSLTPLSEVTLCAIFERVLNNTQKKFPLLIHLTLESNGVQFNGLTEKASELDSTKLKDAFQFFFAALLSVLGNLTADILTPALYSELSKVTVRDRKEGGKPIRTNRQPPGGKEAVT